MLQISAIRFDKLLAIALMIGTATSCQQQNPTADAQQPQGVPVRVAAVKTTTLENTSEFVGNLEARRSVILRPEIDGRITRILVNSGDRVPAGALLVQLEPEQQRSELGGATARIAAARAARENALADLQAQQAQRLSDLADLRLQQEDYRRTAALVREGAVAQQDLDRALSSRDTAAAQVRVTEQRIRAAQAGLAEQDALLQEAQANASSIGVDLDNTRLVAPFTGMVGDIPAKLGDYVQSGDAVATITENEALDLRIAIPVEEGSALRVGLPVQITNTEGQPLRNGQISFISPTVNTDAQTILVKATFANTDGRLRDGQFVRARIIWERRPNAVVIPSTALISQGDQRFVFVVQSQAESPTVQQQSVRVGLVQDDQAEILSGLRPGVDIVVSGSQRLFDGAPVVLLPGQ